jgi:hypothetical protein
MLIVCYQHVIDNLSKDTRAAQKVTCIYFRQLLCGLVVFPTTHPEVPGSIPGSARFSEK